MYSQSEADLVRENRMLSEQLELAHRAQAGLSLDVRSLSEQLADAQATVEALQRERDGLEQNCLNNHVTIEQADAKVMKLEGERGMWATERIDLLTQLENAEFALDAEREKVKGLHEITKVICAHCCEPMEIPSKAALQTQLTQLQALVRALPVPEEGGFPIVEVDGDYYVNHTSRFSTKAEADAYTGLLIYRAALDSMTPDSNQLGDINDMVSKGGNGE